jgi:hypothetical protein
MRQNTVSSFVSLTDPLSGNCDNWLIDYLVFYVPLKNISLIMRRHHYRWRAAKFRLMLGAQGLWVGRDLYRHTCCDTGSRFFWSHPKDRPIQSPLTTRKGLRRTYSYPDPHVSSPLTTRKGLLRTQSFPDLHGLSQMKYQNGEIYIVRKTYFCHITSKKNTSARRIRNIFNIW